MKYGTWTFGQVEALLNRLGEDNARKLLDHREVTVQFSAGKKEEAVVVGEQAMFGVWKTIKVGTGLKTADDFRRAIKEAGYQLSGWASDLLSRPEFVVAAEAGEADLVVVSNADLGRPEGCAYQETCELGIAAGLDLCEPEDGPQLRLQYPDQPRGERLIMAMKAIRDSDGHLLVFGVAHDDDVRWLYSYDGGPDDFRDGGCQFVFRRRKQLLGLKT